MGWVVGCGGITWLCFRGYGGESVAADYGGDYGKFTTNEGESLEYYGALSAKMGRGGGWGEGMRQVNFNVTQSKSSELFPQTINNDRKNE